MGPPARCLIQRKIKGSILQKPGLGFPIARIVAVISYATAAILDLAIGPYAGEDSGEHALLRQLMHVFKPGDIAIGDKYYASFFLIGMLKKLEVDCVFTLHHGRHYDFRRGKKLGKRDHVTFWKRPQKPIWMDKDTYDTFPRHLEVREVFIQNQRKGFRTKNRIIVTTFLESCYVSREDLGALYDYRWNIELDLRSIKEILHMGTLRAKTPEMVRKEMWARLLAYNLIRKMMAQAALLYDKKPRELSFKLALQVIKAFRDRGVWHDIEVFYFELFQAIAYKKVGNRPGRHEPRRIKRRPKPYSLLMKPRSFYHKKTA